MSNNNSIYLTQLQAAEHLSISTQTFKDKREKGEIKLNEYKIGDSIRFKSSELEVCLNNQSNSTSVADLTRKFLANPLAPQKSEAAVRGLLDPMLGESSNPRNIPYGSVLGQGYKPKKNDLYASLGVQSLNVAARGFSVAMPDSNIDSYWLDEGFGAPDTDSSFSTVNSKIRTNGILVPLTRPLRKTVEQELLVSQLQKLAIKAVLKEVHKTFLIGNPASHEPTGLSGLISNNLSGVSSELELERSIKNLESRGVTEYSAVISKETHNQFRDTAGNSLVKNDIMSPTGKTFFGIPAIVSPDLPDNDFILGDFSTSEILVSDTSEVDFIISDGKSNTTAMRVFTDIQNAHYEPDAFVKFTIQN